MSDHVYKYKGKLYSDGFWHSFCPSEDSSKQKYAGNLDDLIELLEEEGKIITYQITYYHPVDSDVHIEEDPVELFTRCGDGLEVEEVHDDTQNN